MSSGDWNLHKARTCCRLMAEEDLCKKSNTDMEIEMISFNYVCKGGFEVVSLVTYGSLNTAYVSCHS